jgi:hypothetical protein
MKHYTRTAAFTKLAPYCLLANDDAFMEVCEWNNGNSDRMFSLTHGELRALIALTHCEEESD